MEPKAFIAPVGEEVHMKPLEQCVVLGSRLRLSTRKMKGAASSDEVVRRIVGCGDHGMVVWQEQQERQWMTLTIEVDWRKRALLSRILV